MKANVRSGAGNNLFHGYEFRLTIGLIVKNAEKRLDRCLSSLEQLRKEVPSELIVTDTGSTDRTVEIAREYTDRVLSFEWCDDFAAARNTGLFAARGEWFLFLDDDEWFEDTTELIRFFSSGECDAYWTGGYFIRSFLDRRGRSCGTRCACRLFRRDPGIRFTGRIHEGIRMKAPTKLFGAFVNNDGFIFRTADEKEKKMRGDLALLRKELEKHPDDPEIYSQIAGLCLELGENEEALAYAERGLRAAPPETVRVLELALNQQRAYFVMDRLGEVMKTADRCLEETPVRGVFHLEMLRPAQIAAFRLQQYRKALEYGDRYLALFRDLEEGRLDRSLLLYAVFPHISAEERQNTLAVMVRCALLLKEDEKAAKIFRRMDFSDPSVLTNGSMVLCFDLYCRTGDSGLLADFCVACLSSGGSRAEEAAAACAESYRNAHPREAGTLRRALAALKPGLGSYTQLCALREAESSGDHAQAREILENLARSKGKLRLFEGDVLYYAMAEGRNVMPLLMRTDSDLFPDLAAQMRRSHTDFPAAAESYLQLYSFQNAVGLRWSACVAECAVLALAASGEAVRCLVLFESYIRLFMKVFRSTYLPEMLSQPLISSLPAQVRFVCTVSGAFAARNRGDGAAYLAGLRTALKGYACMEEPVRFLLARFEKEQKEQERKAEEFAALARQVKQNIEALIAKGDLVRAGQVTAQLAALMPNDEDVRRYEKLTHTEPTMREIASRLPQ